MFIDCAFAHFFFCDTDPMKIGAFNAPKCLVVEVSGFEPLTPCLQGRCSTS